MEYRNIDPTERGKAHVAATGHGDTSVLSTEDALAAEREYVVAALRLAFAQAHIDADDRAKAELVKQVPQLEARKRQAEERRDRIVAATGADVSEVAPAVLAANRAQSEQDHFDADWQRTNIPDLPQAAYDQATLIMERAEREAAVVDAWDD